MGDFNMTISQLKDFKDEQGNQYEFTNMNRIVFGPTCKGPNGTIREIDHIFINFLSENHKKIIDLPN